MDMKMESSRQKKNEVEEEEEEEEAELEQLRMGERQGLVPDLNEDKISDETSQIRDNRGYQARKFSQILAVLAVSFGCYIHGTTVVFPAVFVPSLMASNGTEVSNDTDVLLPDTLPFYIYSNEEALIVSIASFGMLAGSLIAGPMANVIGRKWTCILGTCLSLTLGYALIPFAQHVWMLFLGRFFNGVGLGFSMTISTLYIMEISTPNMRSALAVIPAIAGTLGILTCQCLGAILSWKWLSIALTCLNIPFFLMLLFIPETPVYLIGTEQIDRAHKVLRLLRGKNWDITKELTDLKCASEGAAAEKRRNIPLREFVSSSVLKPFILSLFLMLFFQFSGINIILQYTVDIFKTAESSINVFMANIFLGCALLTSNIISLLIATKMRRRLMLLLSSLGISLSLIAMGVYFWFISNQSLNLLIPMAEKLFNHQNEPAGLDSSNLAAAATNSSDPNWPNLASKHPNLGWLPLMILMFYIFFFNIGYGAMIWITVAEILPQHVRSVTNSLSVAFTCVCSFLTSHTYLSLKETLRAEGVFGLYGTISLFGFFFILIFVPETKGKSESQIQEYFLSKAQRIQRKKLRQEQQRGQQD